MTDTIRPARTRLPLSIWVVALWLPLLLIAVAVAVQLAWMPTLPDPIAIHWGPGDQADGFGPVWSLTVLTAALGVGLTAMLALFLAFSRAGGPAPMHKFIAVVSLAETIFLGGAITASLGAQRGLADAQQAPGTGGWMLLFGGLAVGAGLLAWFLLPRAVNPTPDTAEVDSLDLAPGERGVWIATSGMSKASLIVMFSVLALAVVATVVPVAIEPTLWPLVLISVLLVVVAFVIGVAWRVRVDATGLEVRALPLGVPRMRVSASEITSATVRQVDPLAEFGGWGWRYMPGNGWGIVGRRGEAIEVVRRAGTRLVVQVDDAATAASLLTSYAQKAAEAGNAR